MPRILDAYCNSGGATRGYQLAGAAFVVGVDIQPQPNYIGDEFVQGDAIEFMREHGREFDFIHASPPCQLYSACQRIQGNAHPDLIGPTREALAATGCPWVIENVEDAAPELRRPIMLCGAMFGLRTYRHRLFELSGFEASAPKHLPHFAPNAKMGRPVKDGEFMHIVGNFSGAQLARDIMGMPWASRDNLREAIPPAYTEYIGKHLMEALCGTDGVPRGHGETV